MTINYQLRKMIKNQQPENYNFIKN